MHKDEAARIGMEGLLMLASDEDICLPFLALSGASISDIEARKDDPAFLAFVLEFLLGQDEWVLALANICQVAPEQIMVAQYTLGGGLPHWT